jgi:hypothetical protein
MSTLFPVRLPGIWPSAALADGSFLSALRKLALHGSDIPVACVGRAVRFFGLLPSRPARAAILMALQRLRARQADSDPYIS